MRRGGRRAVGGGRVNEALRIRFLRGWDRYEPSQEVDYPHPGAAAELVRRGIAELVATEVRDSVRAPAPPAATPARAGRPRPRA